MATNLVELTKSYFTPELVQQVSALVGESPPATQKAIDGAIPTLLAGLTNLSGSGSGTTALTNLLKQGNYGSLLTGLGRVLGGGSDTQEYLSGGRSILTTLFGGRLGAVVDLLASAFGLKSTAASSILSLVAPVVLGVLGKEQATQGLGAAGLTSLLLGQKDAIARLAPAGLAGVLGVNNLSELGAQVSRPAPRVTAPAVREGSSLWQWLVPALGLLALGVLYSLWGGSARQSVANITLPGGISMALPENSFNYHLAKFLADGTPTTDPWAFVVDRLNFESGTTQLTAESRQTVADLAAILKAYPSTAVQLEGHTDNTGEAEANKQLSLARAEAVKEALIRSGIEASRVATAGYGQERPVASNDTEAGKAQNRRLELAVVKR